MQFPETHDTQSAHVHPTQIYESVLNLALYGALAWLFRNRKFNGQVFATYLLAYAVLRLAMEFFRADSRGSLWFGTLTSGQGISILLLIAGGAMWYLLSTREKIEPEPSEEQ